MPATALARKPAYYRPVDTIDGEALAAAATAKLAAAIRTRNTGTIALVLGTAFENNGLWFPDAACAKRFERSGTIKGADVGVFARCLAGLKLQMSTRKSTLRDGTILTVDPGIEIELAFKGETLRWIGFPTQAGADRALPMLTAQAIEGLRTAGTTLLDAQVGRSLDPELAKQRALVATTWIKVCLDPTGAITQTVPMNSTSGTASEAFFRAVADWKFKPFKVGGKAVSACAAELLSYPAAKAPPVESYPSTQAPIVSVTRTYNFDDDDLEMVGGVFGPPPAPPPPVPPPINVPPTLLEKLRIAGSKVIVPDAQTRQDMLAAGKSKVVASMKLCLDDKGSVSAVTLLKSSGFPAYDRKISSEMRQWIYKPYKMNGKAIPVCTAETFIYDATKPTP